MAEAEAGNENSEGNNEGENADGSNQEKGGFISRLFGNEGEKCKGMEGLISEGKKMMSSDMSPEAADAAIIASAQKIEHYEISGYGTARAYARELKLDDVAGKLEQTLNEEYKADDLLTELAVGKVNVDAEFSGRSQNSKAPAKSSRADSNNRSNGRSGRNQNKAVAKKSNSAVKSKASPAKSNSSRSASKSGAAKKSGSAGKGNSSGSSNSKAAPKKSQAPVKSKAAAKKSPAKSSKGGSNKSSSSKGRSSRGR